MEIKLGKIVAPLFEDKGIIDKKTNELYLSFNELGNIYCYSENDDNKKFIKGLIKKNFKKDSSVKLIIVDDSMSLLEFAKSEFLYDKNSFFALLNEGSFSSNKLIKLLELSNIRIEFNESKRLLNEEQQEKAFIYKNLNEEILVVFSDIDKYLSKFPNDIAKILMIMKFTNLSKIHFLFGSNKINESILKLMHEEDTIISFKTNEKETSNKLVNNFNGTILKEDHFLILNKTISPVSEEMEISE